MILTLSRYARDATFLKIDEYRPGAPFFKGWIDDSFIISTNFDVFRRLKMSHRCPKMSHTCPITNLND
ncbi:hypothetical protein HH635_004491 [Escherichia coli]|nr:hypothetical protein [Escherichia coli]